MLLIAEKLIGVSRESWNGGPGLARLPEMYWLEQIVNAKAKAGEGL